MESPSVCHSDKDIKHFLYLESSYITLSIQENLLTHKQILTHLPPGTHWSEFLTTEGFPQLQSFIWMESHNVLCPF